MTNKFGQITFNQIKKIKKKTKIKTRLSKEKDPMSLQARWERTFNRRVGGK